MSSLRLKKLNIRSYIFIGILLFAIILRLWGITWRPISNDEASHIYFGIRVLRGEYVYDPEYHGPFEHYLIGVMLYLFKPFIIEDSFTLLILVRMLYAAFSIILIIIAYKFFRDYLGPNGSLVAAFLLAISPEVLYYSRFAHEDVMAASLAVITFIFTYRFLKDKNPAFLYATSVSFFLLFATKENWLIYAGIWISYLILVSIVEVLLKHIYKTKTDVLLKSVYKAIKDYFVKDSKISFLRVFHFVCSILIGIFIAFLLYSSFFTHPDKFLEAIMGPIHWLLRHHKPRIFGPFYYWFDRIWLYDLYLIPGVILAIKKYHDRVSEVLFWWFIISFVGYSYLQEKLPRLMMHITLPGILLVAKYMGDLISTVKIRREDIKTKIIAVSLIVLISISSYQSILLNYVNYDRTEEPLIYARLTREWNDVYKIIEKIEEEKGSVSIALVWYGDTGMWPITFWLYWIEIYFRDLNLTYTTYNVKTRKELKVETLQKYDVIISYLNWGVDNLTNYIRIGDYSVLRWILHERLTTETSLRNFTYDFKHYLSPQFYFLRKYPFDEQDVIDHWCAVYVKEEYSNIVSEILNN